MAIPSDIKSYPDALSLSGKGIVVLGAGGGGIGTETSRALAQAGAQLLCVDFRQQEADEIAEETGGTAHVADITSRAEMEKLFERADALFGNSFAGIVNVVGLVQMGPITSLDDAAIERQFDVVFRHALLATQIGAPLLARNGGGSVVFVGSLSGLRAVHNQGVYGMAKAALNRLAQQAAFEFGPQGVRFNVVAPGFVKTPRVGAAISDEIWGEIERRVPLRRAALPSDIAKAVLFLSSELASYVTGNILTLDGGTSLYMEVPDLSFGTTKAF